MLWTTIQEHTPLDWTLRVVGYIAIATLTLDLAVRYRIRDLYDGMTLMAIVGVLVSLFIKPDFSFTSFPVSLLTRVMGGHTLVMAEMFGLFIVLTAGNNRRYRGLLLAVATWLGFYWGIWMRWNPALSGLFEPVGLVSALIYAAAFFAVPLVLWGIVTRISTQHTPTDFTLSLAEWFVLVTVFLLLFMAQALQNAVNVGAIVTSSLILLICWSILWFRRSEIGTTLLDEHLPITPLDPRWLLGAVGLFVAVMLFAYHLPLVQLGAYNQLWLMEIGFGFVGTVWLPIVATVVSVRGVDYLMRTNKLSL